MTTTDTTTTTVVPTDLTDRDAVVSAYANADRSGKAAIRSAVDRAMRAALGAAGTDPDMITVAVAHNATLSALAPATAPTKAVDYAGVIAQRVADLYAAADDLLRGVVVPDGMPEGAAYDGRVLPDPSDNYRAIASAKVTRVTDRADIAAAILSAVSDTDEWLTMSAVARKMDLPSAGAVAARLFRTDKDGKPVAHGIAGIETGLNAAGNKAVRRA